MAAENWQLETRNAYWAALHADADWTALAQGGTEFSFAAAELLKKLEFEPRMCPIIAIGPASAELPPISGKTLAGDDDTYRVRVELAHRDLDLAEQLALAFHAAMQARWPELCKVRDNRLYQIDVSVEYEPIPAKDSPRPLWLAALTCVNHYRLA